MSDKKYQIFVSSTFRDLQDERQLAIKTILDLDHIPAGMELFPASDTNQFEYIKQVIDQCDYYLLIIGNRYGTKDSDGLGFTEKEYDYAVQTGKCVLAFIHGSPDSLPVSKSDTEFSARQLLETFREKVGNGRLIKYWLTPEGLDAAISKTLSQAFKQLPRVGWVRGDTIASTKLMEQNIQLIGENSKLEEQVRILKEALSYNDTPIEDIADINDEYVIYWSGSYGLKKGELRTTWLELFIAIGQNIPQNKSTSVVEDAIIRIIYKKIEDNNDLFALSIESEYTNTTIFQFEALGLISIQGNELLLTKKGEKFIREALVVRKNS